MPSRRIVPKSQIETESESTDFFGGLDYWGGLMHDFWQFLVAYQWFILVFFLILFGAIFFYKANIKKTKEIKKLWVFILFFLTKRQMLIPLVCSLAKKDGILDLEIREGLLVIRERCRDLSLKKNPIKRLMLERKVSEILFYYFCNLEANNLIKPGTKFEKIVRDLEFIDEKLVELQVVYNREVLGWNQKTSRWYTKFLFVLFRFRPFEKFQMPQGITDKEFDMVMKK